MKKYAVIVAGGSGTRMGTDTPKQFLLLHGNPVLMHTVRVFHGFDPDMKIILVLPDNQIQKWKEMVAEYNFQIPHEVVAGGETRFHSVKNGLLAVKEEGVVAIHDGVRPLVSKETIQATFEAAEESQAAVPCVPVNESMRQIDGDENRAVDRSNYVLIQTPQCFHTTIIQKAFEQDYRETFTDDASVAESIGVKIKLVKGNAENIKITRPMDLKLAEIVMPSH